LTKLALKQKYEHKNSRLPAFDNPALKSAFNPKRKVKMNNKIVTTNGKLADGSTITISSSVQVPETLDELKSLAADSLGTMDAAAIERHLTELFVGWCIAHTYQSQVRSKIKTASSTLTYDQLSDLVSDVKFRIPRPASAPRGDKVVLKKSQLTPQQIEKLKELGLL
jgi:hypothetical protein